MAFDPGLLDWVAEAMAPVGSVTHRKMMGGATLYCDGTIFAIIADDALWFKADAESDAEWDALGCPRFQMQMADRLASMNYRRPPEEVYDDPDELRRLGELGLAAGMRKPRKAKAAKRKQSQPATARPTRR